jgi:vacuole morphology and inheritance protein 14
MRALAWLELLVDLKWPEAAGGTAINTTLLAPLVSMLRDRDEQVLRRTLTVMAKVSAKSDAALPLIVRELLALFAEDSMLMQERSGVMLKELCLRIDPEAVYLRLAAELEAREGDEVARCLTEKLTMILLTVPEMASLRDRLRTDSAPAAHAAARTGPAHVGAGPAHVGAGEAAAAARGGGRELFQALDRAWSRHFPAAGLGLCLLAGEYARSCALVERIGQRMRDSSGEETLRVLVQLDKLVQLVESPVLAPLRMQLLRPAEHPHLVRAMYGVLMLLPQSEAFEVLRRRLKAVPTLALLALAPPPQDPSAAGLLSS